MSWPESYFEGEFNLVEPGSQNQGGEDLSKPQVPRSSVRIRHVLKNSFVSNRMAIFLVVFCCLFGLVLIKNQVLTISVYSPVSFINCPLLLVLKPNHPHIHFRMTQFTSSLERTQLSSSPSQCPLPTKEGLRSKNKYLHLGQAWESRPNSPV